MRDGVGSTENKSEKRRGSDCRTRVQDTNKEKGRVEFGGDGIWVI